MTAAHPVGAEVAVTITGRVIHRYEHGLVLEYVGGCGLLTRTAVDLTSQAVAAAAAEPSPDDVVARQRAARMAVEACRDPQPPEVVLR